MRTKGILFLPLAAALLLAAQAGATTFSLDDNPAAPISSPPGLIPGFGAEDPYGLGIRGAPLAPSPSLVVLPLGAGDGEILTACPTMNVSSGFFYLNAMSNNTSFFGNVSLDFSVDRSSTGVIGTAVNAQWALNQQPGDIFRTTRSFTAPGTFAGALAGAGYVGALPTAGRPGVGNNLLILDESALHLTVTGTPGATTPPDVPGDPITPGSHDNVDAFDWGTFDLTGDWITDEQIYFATNPDEAVARGISPADLWTLGAGFGGPPILYAPAPTLGLLPGIEDDVDALVLWDLGGLGVLEPGIDYALFSLGPGSASLGAPNMLSAADVFFTDFTGSFALYADAWDLGLVRGLGGLTADNVDALEVVPEPVTLLGLLLGTGSLVRYVRRRHRVEA